jgi:hypothetical protein
VVIPSYSQKQKKRPRPCPIRHIYPLPCSNTSQFLENKKQLTLHKFFTNWHVHLQAQIRVRFYSQPTITNAHNHKRISHNTWIWFHNYEFDFAQKSQISSHEFEFRITWKKSLTPPMLAPPMSVACALTGLPRRRRPSPFSTCARERRKRWVEMSTKMRQEDKEMDQRSCWVWERIRDKEERGVRAPTVGGSAWCFHPRLNGPL